QVRDLQLSDAFLAAEGVETIAAFAKQRSARCLKCSLEQLVFLGADSRHLNLALALEFGRRKGRGKQDIRQQFQSGCKVAAHDLRVNAEAVISTVAVDCPADGLDGSSNFFRRTVPGTLEQQVTCELGQAIVVRVLDEHPAFEHSAELDK